jgi:hypothetical protein
VYRGGVVTFRIPAHWREEYSDIEGGTFYRDHPHSGTLRLSIITVTSPKQAESPSAFDVLRGIANSLKNVGVEGTTKGRQDGNAAFKYEEVGLEQGVRLTIFYWIVANALPPRHARVATFSYTIIEEQRTQPQVQHDLEMLDADQSHVQPHEKWEDPGPSEHLQGARAAIRTEFGLSTFRTRFSGGTTSAPPASVAVGGTWRL